MLLKILIIGGGLFYLYRLVMKSTSEIDSANLNEDSSQSNDIEYTDYEEID